MKTYQGFGSLVACWSCSLAHGSVIIAHSILRDHPTVIKRRFTSVLIVSGLSPLFVWAWREFTGVRVSLRNDCLVILFWCHIHAVALWLVPPLVCALDHPIVTGSHGNAVWGPHVCHYTSSAAHHGKKDSVLSTAMNPYEVCLHFLVAVIKWNEMYS